MGKRYVAWILTGRGLLRCRQSPVEQLAYFLKQLNTTRDGDGTLLDRLTLLYGCGISDSNTHAHDNLPILMLGGSPKAGPRHIVCPKDTPLTNLQLSLLERAGVSIEHLADSTGRVDLVSRLAESSSYAV